MRVQCVECNSLLDVPAEKATTPQLQIECSCGALVPSATAQPVAFRLLGSDHTSTSGETAPKPQASAFRLIGAESDTSLEAQGGERTRAATQPFALRLSESHSVINREESGLKRETVPPLRFASPSGEPEVGAAVAEGVAEVTPKTQHARTETHKRGTSTATIPTTAPRSRTGKPRPGAWRQCVEHLQVKSETMCPTCAIGYCAECEKPICPTCDSPCIPASGYQKWLEQERLRARPMMNEIKTILAYPLQDPLAFFLFAAITGFFGFAALFSARAIIFSWGILLWYSFHTLYQVASGNLTRFIPEFNDISDLTQPLRLSGAALFITWGPLLLLGVLFTANVGMGMGVPSILRGSPVQEKVATPPSEEDPALAEVQSVLGDFGDEKTGSENRATKTKPERAASSRKLGQSSTAASAASAQAASGVSLLLLVALLWKVAYTPVALIVAALSRNVWSVLNPVIGVNTIRRMGPVYWHVMLIYTGLTVAELGMGKLFGLMPIVGNIGMAFVKAYIAIAIGCALGLAVYKKAPELGWD